MMRQRAGAAATDITPVTWPVRLIGNFGLTLSRNAHDPLHARALVLDDAPGHLRRNEEVEEQGRKKNQPSLKRRRAVVVSRSTGSAGAACRA